MHSHILKSGYFCGLLRKVVARFEWVYFLIVIPHIVVPLKTAHLFEEVFSAKLQRCLLQAAARDSRNLFQYTPKQIEKKMKLYKKSAYYKVLAGE